MNGRSKIGATLSVTLLLAVLCVLPFVLSPFWVGRITGWIPLAVGALGLNLLTGYNGQISVGHGALYGLGAYTGAILVGDLGLPLPVAMIGAACVCFAAGALIGLPALRIKGLYLALVTLAVATLFPDLVKAFDSLTGGSSGYKIRTPQLYRGRIRDRLMQWLPPEGSGLAKDQWLFFVYLLIAVVCFVLVRNLVNSRAGRAIVAVRDNEIAAEVNGVNVAQVKVLTFGLSSALAGLGGAMFAFKEAQVFPGSFTIAASLYFLVAVVIGGPASVLGPAFGALAYGLFADVVTPALPERLQPATPLILGASLVTMMLVAPGGLVGMARTALNRIRPPQFGPATHVSYVVNPSADTAANTNKEQPQP